MRGGCLGLVCRRPGRSRPGGSQSSLGGCRRQTPPGLCWLRPTPGRVRIGSADQPGAPAPDHARLQNLAGKLGQKIWSAWEHVQQLEKRRAAIPRRVPVQSVTDEPVIKLAPERKHLTNLIKMVAYQSGGDLFRFVGPHYCRADDEGRALMQSALANPANHEEAMPTRRVTRTR